VTEPATDDARSPRQKRIRAFLAINFPLATVRRIADEVEALRPAVTATGMRVAWVPAANLHLTLKFLGAIPEESVEAIRDRLRRELSGRAGFELGARGMGAFPSAAHPRVLWVGVAESAALAALQQDVEGWMEELGFARESRPFHPHVTFGRVSSGSASLVELLAGPEAQPRQTKIFGGGRVQEVVLYESRTLRTGAEYHPLARIPLASP
jgi:2'-5' RNA ligase